MSHFTDDTIAKSDEDNMTDLASDLVNYTIGANMTFTDVFIEELAFALNVYFTPVLIILGTIGNLLSIIVFFNSKLRAQSTSQYLSALAVSDTICLLQLIPPWLKAVRLSLIFGQEGFCQSFVYLTYVSSSSSSWLVVSFTVERFVAVLYPLRRTRMCTVHRARVLIIIIVLSCITINTPVLKFAVPKGNDCNIDYDLMDHAARFNVVDTIFSFTLPLTIITVLNIWIMIGVCRLSRARGHLITEEAGCLGGASRATLVAGSRVAGRGGGAPGGRARRTRSSLQRSQQRITRMLLIVSSVFVVLNLPAYSMRIVAYANNMSSYEYNGRWAALQQICLLFFNSNFGINFFLYCMTGQNFRRALCQTFSSLARCRTAVGRVCGARAGNDSPPPPRPSVTNSVSINTEASGYAGADRVNHSRGAKGIAGPSRRKGSAYANYADMWRINKSSHDESNTEQCELQVFPVCSNWRSSDRLERPVARRPVPHWPQNSIRSNPSAAVRSPIPPRITSPRIMSSNAFKPIRYELVPGQVAPPHPAAAFEPSPSPVEQDSSQAIRRSPMLGCSSPQTGRMSLDELVGYWMRASPPFRRPQPHRKFSLPARELYGLERENTPVGWRDALMARSQWPTSVRASPARVPPAPPAHGPPAPPTHGPPAPPAHGPPAPPAHGPPAPPAHGPRERHHLQSAPAAPACS